MRYFLLIFLLTFISFSPVHAQNPSPTKASSLDEIQKIRQAVQDKVREKLKEISSPTSKKGLVGTIVQIDGNQITLEYKNQTRLITINDNATIIDLKRNKTTLANLKVGQEILAMGIYDNTANTMSASRLILIELKTVEPKTQIVAGRIVDISKTSSLIVLIPLHQKDSQFQIKTDSKTLVTTTSNSNLAFKDLATGQRIITIISPDPKAAQTYLASKIINLDYQPSPTPTKKTAN